MEQLWEILGRGALDNALVDALHRKTMEGPQSFTNFVNRKTVDGGLGYRLSRAEMADLYNLTSHATVVAGGVEFTAHLKQALRDAGVPETDYSRQSDLAEFRTFLGMLFIDNRIHEPIFTIGDAAAIEKIASDNNFAPGIKPCDALYRLVKDGSYSAVQTIHNLHMKWTPPDCFSALSFSDILVEPTPGGVRRADGIPPFGKPSSAQSTYV